MSEFNPKTLSILGRQPQLGVAELERLYGSQHIKPIGEAALLDLDVNDINFKRLGGTVKLARVLSVLPTTKWSDLEKYLAEKIPEHLKYVDEGKFTLGLSAYSLDVNASTVQKTTLAIKKIIKKDRSVRVIPNKSPALNSAQVLHNKLTSKGAWELIFVKNGNQTILAQTMFVQDIEAYAARDQARPKRDSRVGMLPPKLAQIIVNLSNPPANGSVLDPFCGTGVILQEALLMGNKVYGTDIEPRMVDFSDKNLSWLKTKKTESPDYSLEVGDATSHKWQKKFDSVASEVYLGRPLVKLPQESELKQIISDTNTILKKFLLNLSSQVDKDVSICLAIPAWRQPNGKFYNLPVIDHLTDMGYNLLDLKHVSREDLIYYREDQVVARQLIMLKKVK